VELVGNSNSMIDQDLSIMEDGGIMGIDDKIDNKAQETAGKAKEAAGKATDDEQLEAQGHKDRTAGNLKQAGEKVKDAFKKS
jgi:uncharacterized protein YjbJ (UPF0337 family)